MRAVSTGTPSRKRATPVRLNRNDAVARVDCAAVQTSLRVSGKLNAAAITPMTSAGSPSSVIDQPTMLGSAPNCRTQSPCDSTATGAAPVTPSASVNHRPSAGETRSTDASDCKGQRQNDEQTGNHAGLTIARVDKPELLGSVLSRRWRPLRGESDPTQSSVGIGTNASRLLPCCYAKRRGSEFR